MTQAPPANAFTDLDKAKKVAEEIRSIIEGNPPNPLVPAVPQIKGVPKMTATFEMVSPGEAQRIIAAANNDPEFRQRPTYDRDLRRWSLLMEEERFVDYLPSGPLCFTERTNTVMNGKHRMMALSQARRSHGFLIVRNVPVFMFPFFDSGRTRTINDVFFSSDMPPVPKQNQIAKLLMRYFEMVYSVRKPLGWKSWNGIRDEHQGVAMFLKRHDEMIDLWGVAKKAATATELQVPALVVFRYVQLNAWPAGAKKFAEFWNGLALGANLSVGDPALTLREWGREENRYGGSYAGKTQLHLMLLFQMFEAFAKGERVTAIKWGHGMEMPLPYHPSGAEAARKTLMKFNDSK